MISSVLLAHSIRDNESEATQIKCENVIKIAETLFKNLKGEDNGNN